MRLFKFALRWYNRNGSRLVLPFWGIGCRRTSLSRLENCEALHFGACLHGLSLLQTGGGSLRAWSQGTRLSQSSCAQIEGSLEECEKGATSRRQPSAGT